MALAPYPRLFEGARPYYGDSSSPLRGRGRGAFRTTLCSSIVTGRARSVWLEHRLYSINIPATGGCELQMKKQFQAPHPTYLLIQLEMLPPL